VGSGFDPLAPHQRKRLIRRAGVARVVARTGLAGLWCRHGRDPKRLHTAIAQRLVPRKRLRRYRKGRALRQQGLNVPPTVVAKLGMSLGELEELHRGLTALNDAASGPASSLCPPPRSTVSSTARLPEERVEIRVDGLTLPGAGVVR
jgi:hypothetical protein